VPGDDLAGDPARGRQRTGGQIRRQAGVKLVRRIALAISDNDGVADIKL
jgi:hypothetical protein